MIIVNNEAEFEAALDYYKPIFMSETKLKNQIESATFMPLGYHAPLRKETDTDKASRDRENMAQFMSFKKQFFMDCKKSGLSISTEVSSAC